MVLRSLFSSWLAVWLFTPFPPAYAQSGSAALVGRWSAPAPWPAICIPAHLLPNKKVLCWGRGETDVEHPRIVVWNPPDNTFRDVPNDRSNVFCAGHSFLATGELLVTGGHEAEDFGIPDANIFDYRTNTWRGVQDGNAGDGTRPTSRSGMAACSYPAGKWTGPGIITPCIKFG